MLSSSTLSIPTLKLANGGLKNKYKTGHNVWKIGSSDFWGGHVEKGHIQHLPTVKNQVLVENGNTNFDDQPFQHIVHTAQITAGDSGGPLISAKTGKVIGMNYGSELIEGKALPSNSCVATSASEIRRKLKEWGFDLVD